MVSISYTATGAELPPSAAHNTTDNVALFDDLDSEEFSDDTPVLSIPVHARAGHSRRRACNIQT